MFKTSKQEQFSIAYIKALAAPLGFNPGKFDVDNDSVDISFTAQYDINSKIRSPEINIQLKCTQLTFSEDNLLHYPLPIKNYTDLQGSNLSNPRYLVVLCVPSDENDWLSIDESEMILRYSAYWFSLRYEPETKNTKTVTIKIPKNQLLNKESFKMLMDKASEGIGL
ncbi:MAG: DUF4365 domain-containing protein [Bacteroidales bacterium]|jgi:hypothetical protein|nr:DUF4365 domain-containing protein [Bacteroidales bacterium]